MSELIVVTGQGLVRLQAQMADGARIEAAERARMQCLAADPRGSDVP